MTAKEKIDLLCQYTIAVKIAEDERQNLISAEKSWNGLESSYPYKQKESYDSAIDMRDELKKKLEQILSE